MTFKIWRTVPAKFCLGPGAFHEHQGSQGKGPWTAAAPRVQNVMDQKGMGKSSRVSQPTSLPAIFLHPKWLVGQSRDVWPFSRSGIEPGQMKLIFKGSGELKPPHCFGSGNGEPKSGESWRMTTLWKPPRHGIFETKCLKRSCSSSFFILLKKYQFLFKWSCFGCRDLSFFGSRSKRWKVAIRCTWSSPPRPRQLRGGFPCFTLQVVMASHCCNWY